jgi:hypothetical protein
MTNAFYELSLPQDSALTAPRPETERLPETLTGQIYVRNLLARPSSSHGSNQRNNGTHGKVNCLTPKVNTFFGSLLITIFQKRDYLKIKN